NLWTIFKGELKACHRTELQPISQEPPAAKPATLEQQAALRRTRVSHMAQLVQLAPPAQPVPPAPRPELPLPWRRNMEARSLKSQLRQRTTFPTKSQLWATSSRTCRTLTTAKWRRTQ